MRLHAILQFQCPFTFTVEPGVVWFCSHECREKFTNQVCKRNANNAGSISELGFARAFNNMGQCGECTNNEEKG